MFLLSWAATTSIAVRVLARVSIVRSNPPIESCQCHRLQSLLMAAGLSWQHNGTSSTGGSATNRPQKRNPISGRQRQHPVPSFAGAAKAKPVHAFRPTAPPVRRDALHCGRDPVPAARFRPPGPCDGFVSWISSGSLIARVVLDPRPPRPVIRERRPP